MSPATSQVSYRDLAPLESGGVNARNGFEFQDHVAAGYCIDMLSDDSLIEVWCETLDDITLIRVSGDDEIFEFVQVKNNRLNHLWSTSGFCKQDFTTENKKKIKKLNSSIFEKLFANERAEAKEKCLFRMVTAFAVNNTLKILTYPLSSPPRNSTNNDLCDLCNEIGENIPNYKNPNGCDTTSCLSRTVWDVRHDDKSVENTNLRSLRTIISIFRTFPAEDQLNELYKKILRKVQEAGKADWNIDPDLKKITKQVFIDWIKTEINLTQHPSSGGTGNRLREKMIKAGIPEDVIENAQEQRRFYRNLSLNQEYMNLSKREEIEMDVTANLQQLISELDSEQLKVDGVGFHSICLNRLKDISSNKQDVSLPFLYGFMYYMTERCVYRFVRAGA